jgi:hypothetical protein
MNSDSMMSAFNGRRFEGEQGALKLATDVLFNQGFKRYWVELLSARVGRRVAVVWAKDRGQLTRTLNTRGFLLVQVSEMPIGVFFAQQRPGERRWSKEFCWRDEAGVQRRAVEQFVSVESAGDWVLWPEDAAQTEREQEAQA